MIKNYNESTFLLIAGVSETRSHVHCQRVFRNKPCYTFTGAPISQSITSEILDPADWFFSDHWKFNIDSNNVKINRTKDLLFFR